MPLPGKPKPRCGTLTETNIAPENGWLEYDCFPLRWPIFKGYVSFREVKWFSYSFVGFSGSTLAFGEPAATPAPFWSLSHLRGEEAKAAKWLKRQSCWSSEIILKYIKMPIIPSRPEQVQCFIFLQQIPNVHLWRRSFNVGVGQRSLADFGQKWFRSLHHLHGNLHIAQALEGWKRLGHFKEQVLACFNTYKTYYV